MGAGPSKATVLKNHSNNVVQDQELAQLFQDLIDQYSEFVDEKLTKHYTDLAKFFASEAPSASKDLTTPVIPDLGLMAAFNQSCNEKVIASFAKKLQKFPKWRLQKSGMFGISAGAVIDLSLKDESVAKSKTEMCTILARLYFSVLDLIRESITKLISCRKKIQAVSQKAKSTGIAESTANKKWFAAVVEVQKMYNTQVSNINKLFKTLKGTTQLYAKKVDELIEKLNKINSEMMSFPGRCNVLMENLESGLITTITVDQSVKCKELKIKQINCNAGTIKLAESRKQLTKLNAQNYKLKK